MIARLFAVFSMLFMSVLLLSSPVKAAFDPLGPACQANPNDISCKESASVQPDTAENPVTRTINKVANIIAVAAGAIAVIIIIIAGITMTLSGGDSGKVKSSRDAIIYAVVGLIVIVLARSIVVFIINRVAK